MFGIIHGWFTAVGPLFLLVTALAVGIALYVHKENR